YDMPLQLHTEGTPIYTLPFNSKSLFQRNLYRLKTMSFMTVLETKFASMRQLSIELNETANSDNEQDSIEEGKHVVVTQKQNPITHRKIKGVFRKEWLSLKKYLSWLKEMKSDSTKSECKACSKQFSVKHGGKADIDKHMRNIHQLSMKTFDKNPLITSTAVPSTELDNISAAEECTINIPKTIFESSSSVAKSITCGNTKSRAIACNVLGPFFTSTLIDELLESRFSSNKGNCKTYPFAVQFFSDIDVKRGNCYAHEYLTIDIEASLCKIYSHFSRSAKRVEELKTYYEFIQCEYAVSHRFAVRANLQLQRTYTTAADLHPIVNGLIQKLQQRLNEKHYSFSTRTILQKLDKCKAEQLTESFELFIDSVIEYIKSYYDDDKDFYEKISYFTSPELVTWNNVITVAEMV
ncbi:unnamed protein product, partial [Didymodactylos carnosus]